MKKSLAIAAAFWMLLCIARGCFAQRPEFVDMANRRFLKQAPKIGTEVVEVSVFDGQGEELKLGSTRGKHTVLIFGCLT